MILFEEHLNPID